MFRSLLKNTKMYLRILIVSLHFPHLRVRLHPVTIFKMSSQKLLTAGLKILPILKLQTLAELQNAIADLSLRNFLIAFMAVGRYLSSSISEAEKESPKARNTHITSSSPHN